MVLSGFVLAMSYQPRFETLGTRAAFALFIKHRVARLYPLYVCMTLVCFVLGRCGWLTFILARYVVGGAGSESGRDPDMGMAGL